MSRATLKATVAAAVAAGGTFTVAYVGQAQADFTSGQTVNVEVYGGQTECAVSFGASEATITWPGGASYSLPAGEYYIDFDLVGGDEVDRVNQAENQADSVAATVGDLVTDFNSLLAKLKAAGLMVPDA